MTDSQNNNTAWNEWANYVLEISKKHDTNIDELYDFYNKKCLDIDNLKEVKLSREEFQKFLINDYVIFKTEVLTKAKMTGVIWGAVTGGIVSFIIMLLAKVLNI